MNPLLKLSREVLEKYFEGKEVEVPKEIIKNFSEKKACFVTLTKNGNLRGQMGNCEPRQELYRDVIENTINAAFHDSQSEQLKREELSAVKIEISVLTIPVEMEFENSKDILEKLNSEKDGVIIKKGFQSATHLPSVWKEISNKREFLSSLCEKAGLSSDAWEKPGVRIWIYNAESVKED